MSDTALAPPVAQPAPPVRGRKTGGDGPTAGRGADAPDRAAAPAPDSSRAPAPHRASPPVPDHGGGGSGGGGSGGSDRSPAPGAADLAAAGNAALFGLLKGQGGDFVVDLGPAPGIRIPAHLLTERKIDLSDHARVIPGLKLDSAKFAPRDLQHMLRIAGHFDIPYVKESGFEIVVSDKGRASLAAEARVMIGAIGDPSVKIALDENKQLGGSVSISPKNLTPQALQSRMTVTGGGEIRLADGRLSGDVNATLAFPRLGGGALAIGFSENGTLTGSGNLALDASFLNGVHADLGIDEAGSLTGTATIEAGKIAPTIAGLKVESGTVTLAYLDGTPSGALDNLLLSYPGLGSASVSATIAHGQIEGKGAFDLALAGVADVHGAWAFHEGGLTGAVTINAKDFPKALPVKSGAITATLDKTGAVSFKGQVAVTLGPAGSGELRAAYTEAGEVMIGATVNLTVPGLSNASFTINYLAGELEGTADIPIDTELLPGIKGAVHVAFKEGRWAGGTVLAYNADDGKLSGSIHVEVAQTEAGPIQVSGGGDVTAQLIPGKLQGTLTAALKTGGGIDISGKITVTEPIELFPEMRTEKELFRLEKHIPLWAILVAVIRVRAGLRAGIGPGVFRNISVEGSYTIGAGGDAVPSFTVSGEVFIPAFAEAYVAFGAGLGLDVVVGSLTGGIEGVATAGIYGAVSVIPELSYAAGDWMIEGTATLAAGARFKLGLNAWAEIEAFWVTVWERKWELGEWVWNLGPDLALQAHMAYNFSKPEPPTLDFKTSDIDSASLITAAMPKDGPAPSGAKEALQNKAEWKGALKAPSPTPSLPPEAAQKAEAPKAGPAPAKPAKPPLPPGVVPGKPGAAGAIPAPGKGPIAGPAGMPGAPGASGGAADATASAKGPAPGQPPSPGSADANAVQAAGVKPATPEQKLPPGQQPKTDQPRFPKALSLAMLDDPPVPLPRTAEQQQEDVTAAVKVVELAEGAVEDTAALEAYFPRIRRRFQLSAISLEPEGAIGAKVKVEINPVAFNSVKELLRGDDLARSDNLKLKTAVQSWSDALGGDVVGTKMEASLIGPDHPKGSGPSGQDNLMGKLNKGSAPGAGNFIRGHLLNDNIGGPGVPDNLFPITRSANAQHEQNVESRLKKWINQDRYWCYYKVEIQHEEDNFASNSEPNYVSADIVTTAAVLRTDGTRDASHSDNRVTVHSKAMLQTTPAPPGATGAATVGLTTTVIAPKAGVTVHQQTDDAVINARTGKAEAFDLTRPVALSNRAREGTKGLDPQLSAAMQTVLSHCKDAVVQNKVMEIAGIGPATTNLLIRLSRNPADFALLSSNDIGLVTQLNDDMMMGQVLAKLRQLQPA